jgi:TRAP transporter TAXI family solute receptor
MKINFRLTDDMTLVAGALIILLVAQVGSAAESVKHYSFSGSRPGGDWDTMAVGICKLLNDKLPANIKVDIVASGGSEDNARRLAFGEADMTLTYSVNLWEVWNGKGTAEKIGPNHDARILFEITSSSHYFVTLKDKKILSMKDLEGKKVVIGAKGSGTSENSRRVLGALGIKATESELAFGDAARSLQDGKVDALAQNGHPAGGIVELATSNDIFVIPFTEEDLDKIVQVYPFFSKGKMPANVYRGQDKPVPCYFYNVYLMANKKVPDDLVYNAMKIFFSPEGKSFLASVHRNFKPMRDNPVAVKQIGVPYHPGAEKFWKEKSK